jgi:hypothetical protein
MYFLGRLCAFSDLGRRRLLVEERAMGFTAWAHQQSAPGLMICRTAFGGLDNSDESYRGDRTWDEGFDYNQTPALISQLQSLCRSRSEKVSAIAIAAHGPGLGTGQPGQASGQWYINGDGAPPVGVHNLPDHTDLWRCLNSNMEPYGVVYLMGCRLGLDASRPLLVALSRLLPHRRIVAYNSELTYRRTGHMCQGTGYVRAEHPTDWANYSNADVIICDERVLRARSQ